jgi:nitronate monooxygenase
MPAGGHGMSEPLFALLPQVADARPGTLVVATGGIADGWSCCGFDAERRRSTDWALAGRLLRNRHAETWLRRENELEARMQEVWREYTAAREHGDFNVAGVIAGESSGLIHDIPPAGAIVERVITEAQRLIGSRGSPSDRTPFGRDSVADVTFLRTHSHAGRSAQSSSGVVTTSCCGV